MPLGKQFQNTFHTDERGNVTFHTDPAVAFLPHAEGEKPGNQPFVNKGPEGVAKGHKGVAYQGMLFSPEHFTGLKNDPTIPEDERKSVIQKSLHLGADEFTKNIKGQSTQRDAEVNRAAITDAAHETAIPTHMFKQDINVPVIASTKLGRGVGGDFSGNSNLIRTLTRPTRVEVGQETVMHQPRQYSGKNLVNPEWEKDTAPISHRLKDDALHYGYGGRIEAQHMFSGKGESTEEYGVNNIKLHAGYGPSGRSKYKLFHTRQEKAPIGEPRELTRPVFETKITSSSDTIAHEIGHSLDKNIRGFGQLRNPKGADSAYEGLADGMADRFQKHGHSYERALEPSEERATEIKHTGYGLKNKEVAGSPLKAALYAAVRTHVAMGDKNYQDILNRKDLYEKAPLPGTKKHLASQGLSWEVDAPHDEKVKHANKLLLGHLYTTHSHVRDSLGHLGLDHVGKDAANHYRTHITDAGQDPLPGFEHHGE